MFEILLPERLGADDAQLTMAVLATLLGEPAAAEEPAPTQAMRERERQKPTGRKPLPDDVQRVGLDAFERIGQDVSETVERRPRLEPAEFA